MLGEPCRDMFYSAPMKERVQGGSTTLEECAAAVRELDGSNGCMGDYFFFEYGGYCNCPTDSCSLGYENSNAGGDGQLYKFTGPFDVSSLFRIVQPHPPLPSPPLPSPSLRARDTQGPVVYKHRPHPVLPPSVHPSLPTRSRTPSRTPVRLLMPLFLFHLL